MLELIQSTNPSMNGKKYNGGIPQTNMQGDMNIEVRSCSCSSKSPARMDQPLMEPEYDMNIVRKQ